MTRDTAVSKPIDPGMLMRIAGGLRSWLGMAGTAGSPELPFFPPGQTMQPAAPGAAGRRFDYPTAFNMTYRPRSYERIDFDTLRAMADPAVGGYDLLRLAIETRKDQMAKLVFSILPRKQANETSRPKSDARCAQIEQLLRVPDGHMPWQQWCSELVEEHLVIDAATIYRRRSIEGDTIKLELMDGALITPRLNYDGRRPDEGVAYTQILKGLPAVDYSKDELLYMPRNPRVNKVYGYSPVEQVITTVNIALRRQAGQLGFFTEGNIPDAISQVPPTWTLQQISDFQDYWDAMVNDSVRRRKMRFVPAGTALQMTRADTALTDQFDEWLARIIAYAFSLPPTPFVRMMNRATAESSYEEALSEGLQPLMIWMKGILDYIIANWFGFNDLECVWDDIKKTDPAEKEERDLALIQQGVISRDDMRADRGLEPLGVPAFVTGFGPLGFMGIESIKKAIANGWDLTGLPQPAAPGMPQGDVAAAGGGDPSLIGTGQDGDPLNGMPPEIMEALGLNPQPQPGTQGAPAMGGADMSNVVPIHQHPLVQAAYQSGDATAKRLAAKMKGAPPAA